MRFLCINVPALVLFGDKPRTWYRGINVSGSYLPPRLCKPRIGIAWTASRAEGTTSCPAGWARHGRTAKSLLQARGRQRSAGFSADGRPGEPPKWPAVAAGGWAPVRSGLCLGLRAAFGRNAGTARLRPTSRDSVTGGRRGYSRVSSQLLLGTHNAVGVRRPGVAGSCRCPSPGVPGPPEGGAAWSSKSSIPDEGGGNPADRPHPPERPTACVPVGPEHTDARSPPLPGPAQGVGTASPCRSTWPVTDRPPAPPAPTDTPDPAVPPEHNVSGHVACFFLSFNCTEIHNAQDPPFKPHDLGAVSAFSVRCDRRL